MSPLDWGVLGFALAGFVAYGLWRSRGRGTLDGFLLADRKLRWPTVALSVMATQASAITFLSTPGQGYADGLRFVQFYFGLPIAMVVLCTTAVPIFHRLKVYTAYEYLERRFDAKTRTLASTLFLIQRGLAAGLTIYAPALVLSVILGVDVRWMCILLGGIVVIYTATGGSRAVSHTHALQFLIILGTMALAFALVIRALPAGVSFGDSIAIAGHLGKLRAVNFAFDPNDRYNLWSGLIGGFFLQLSYFGTDQSQVGRYLGGQSVTQSRLGLLFNGLFKIPMQFAILLLGVLVFVFYLFHPTPLFFNPVERAKVAAAAPVEWKALESRHHAALDARAAEAGAFMTARHAGDSEGAARAARALGAAQGEVAATRVAATALIRAHDAGAQTNDTNYVFLTFVLAVLPAGVIGLVLAAIFAASMNSTSSELNALASTTVVDVVQRLPGAATSPERELWISRLATVFWAIFAIAFAEYASRLGSLIEAVNVLGSLFYGTILGIFLTAFYLKRVGGTPVFIAALIAEAVVIWCFRNTAISFLWYNLIGCALVVLISLALSAVWSNQAPAPGERQAEARI